MTRTYELSLNRLQDVSPRVRRLYAIASFNHIKEFASRPLIEAITFAEREMLPLDLSPETPIGQLGAHRAKQKHLQQACRDALNELRRSHAEDKNLYKMEIAAEIAHMTLEESIPYQPLAGCAWGIRGWLRNFDVDLCDCLDLCGPYRPPAPPSWPNHVTRLAQACSEGDWGSAGILADAIDDANFPALWINHLRKPQHWNGCWVVDKILGRQ